MADSKIEETAQSRLPSPVSALKKRMLSGGVWALSGRVVNALAVLAANALLARMLSPQELGAYFLAFSIVSLGALMGSLGLNQAVVRFVAESVGLGRLGQTRGVLVLILVLGGAGALVVGLAYLFFGRTIGAHLFDAPALVAVTGLVAGWATVLSLQTILAEAFRGFNDIRLATIFNGSLAWVLLLACLGLLWLVRGGTSLHTVVVLSAASVLASLVAAGWLLRRKVGSLPRTEEIGQGPGVGKILRVAWPIMVTNLTLFAVTQADLWIMGAFQPQEEVAVYGAAARMVLLVATPLVIVNAVVPPMIVEMYARGRRRELERTLRTTATLAGIPAFAVLAGLVLFGGPVLGLVFGDYYRAGALVLALLSLGQMANVWFGSCGMTLMMTGHQTIMMLITVASSVATIGVGLGMVSLYGGPGVATAAAAGLALQNLLLWLAARWKTGMWTHVRLVAVADTMKALR